MVGEETGICLLILSNRLEVVENKLNKIEDRLTKLEEANEKNQSR